MQFLLRAFSMLSWSLVGGGVRRVCFLFLLALGPAAASAATVDRHCYRLYEGQEDATCSILLKGEIKAGDTDRLVAFAARPENAELARARHVTLDSPGGDVSEAVRLAELLRNTFATTSVLPGSVCASACFLLWIGSAEHRASQVGGARIGLHRPYFHDAAYASLPPAKLAAEQAAAMQEVRAFLQAQNLSQRLIDEMMRRPSNDVYWLTPADVREIGTYSPWLEEILIRRCDYGNAKYKSLRAKGRMTDADFKKVMLPVLTCTADVLGEKRTSIPFTP